MIAWLSDNAGLIGLLFFFGFFTGLLVWIFRPGSKAKYSENARIPLKGDDEK